MTDAPTADPLLASLRDLAEPAPATLADRVVDGWVRAPSPLGEVYAVAGAGGVRLVRTAAYAGDLEVFLEDYRTRHGRPVRPATRAPRGLLPALRGTGGPPELDLTDVGDFARKVLAATARIPAGQIRPYGWVAREAGPRRPCGRWARRSPATRSRCSFPATAWCAATAASGSTSPAPGTRRRCWPARAWTSTGSPTSPPRAPA